MNEIRTESIPDRVYDRPVRDTDVRPDADDVLARSADRLLAMQRSDGYWWYTLEANETIGAEFIFLMHFLDAVDTDCVEGIARRIRDVQRRDGSWALYDRGPADLSTTIECYFALKLAGESVDAPHMLKARDFVRSRGGLAQARVFTKIHLAMFGVIPWGACPEMPAEAILLPSWFPLNIYEFSSWARATIVPLLAFMTVKPVRSIPHFDGLGELLELSAEDTDWSYRTEKSFFSWEAVFIYLDRALKLFEKIPFKPLRKSAINKCISWTTEHVARTEDIYPALAYAALMYKALGYETDTPEIRKPFEALKRFQQHYPTSQLPAMPDELTENDGVLSPAPATDMEGAVMAGGTVDRYSIHQQCCISPVWDTPWIMTALMEAGIPADAPALTTAARWLARRQITECYGDWAVKNPGVEPGGWSFEFENDYFPDVDDTIQILHVLENVGLPREEIRETLRRGYRWLLSMQNDDGGWAAFDRNNSRMLVNKIPFADHGACLDPSSPDITGRAVELLARRGYTRRDRPLARALEYIWATQERNGSWWARWGINYIYGTWAVLSALGRLNWDLADPRIRQAVGWLLATQRRDGGWGESPAGYDRGVYVPWHESVPSQTAWALMALVAAGEADSVAAERAAGCLERNCDDQGGWEESAFTGTGFPGHFYIRYHGYRHYFPVLALARYRNA